MLNSAIASNTNIHQEIQAAIVGRNVLAGKTNDDVLLVDESERELRSKDAILFTMIGAKEINKIIPYFIIRRHGMGAFHEY